MTSSFQVQIEVSEELEKIFYQLLDDLFNDNLNDILVGNLVDGH